MCPLPQLLHFLPTFLLIQLNVLITKKKIKHQKPVRQN